ncbi:MAG: PhnD/SsuA/transferrin family substrate-binding protein [Chromatiales bacterium]|jgi:phosphonate transport system substrate-binding protein|nr:PhnD/SsuA/transferrin family substrate-binding protein [Chromatiales bacterium]MDX9767118.1 PhnD/SsuA/transferrin family substrate-binding protein [Ectothiorhodospiraceae bacterium]
MFPALRHLSRRVVLCLLLFAGTAAMASQQPSETPLRIGLTPVFLDDQAAFLNRWRDYLQDALGRPVSFVQRSSYREIIDLLHDEKLDVAWLCGYPYVRERSRMQLLAVPKYRGKPLYRSYLIVPASDTRTRSLADLKGGIFAYSDPNSNSGYLYTQYSLRRMGQDADTYFRRSFFTWSHRKVVEAVANRLAQGGAVDGYVWDTLARLHPGLVAKTRIVEESQTFGFPPFVARASLDRMSFDAMQRVLTEMDRTPAGAALLDTLNLDGFVVGEPALFDDIERMVRAMTGP